MEFLKIYIMILEFQGMWSMVIIQVVMNLGWGISFKKSVHQKLSKK